MPKLKATTDASGNVFYPVTIAEGIYDNDNSQTLDETLSGINTTLGGLGTAATKNVASSGNASSSQVVMGNDTRLSDSRPASDVYEWAKASTKPTYTKSEVGLGNVDNTADASKSVAYADNAGTVNNHSVNADVPSGAVFTDTTYESKAAVEDGTDISLVTTGEKYSWNEKAEKDGNYPDLVAGNLVGAQSQESTFSYRPSAGSIDIDASGNATPGASLQGIKGNAVAWNQLVQNGNFADGATGWNALNSSTFSVSNGELTLTKAAGVWSGLYQYVPLVTDHKYYTRLDAKIVMENGFLGLFLTDGEQNYVDIGAFSSTDYNTFKSITTFSSIGDRFYILARGNESAGEFCKIKDFYLIDLTLIYGSGNEPVTPEAFEADYLAWFGKPLGYEEYDAGSLRPVKMAGLKTVGFNQFDGQWPTGLFTNNCSYTVSGDEITMIVNGDDPYIGLQKSVGDIYDNIYGPLVRVLPNTTYHFHATNNIFAGNYLTGYNKEKICIASFYEVGYGYADFDFTTPADCYYITLRIGTGSGITSGSYTTKICINLSNSGRRNGEYEPYWESLLNVPVTTMKGRKDGTGSPVVVFPDGLKKAGTVYDEVVKRGSQTIGIKRIGSVDIGTCDLYYQTDWGDYPNFRFQTLEVPLRSLTVLPNVACPSFKMMTANDFYNNNDDKSMGSSDFLRFRDHEHNDTDLVNYRAPWLNGVILYYELATPEEYILDDFELPQSYYVDDWGTEEVVAPTGQVTIAPTLSMEYGVNAPDAIMNLPRNYVSAHEQQTFTESQMLRARTNIGLNDMARLGCGMGICTTNATTAAKEVSISSFLLVKHGEITVFFEKAVDVADATLNVSGTGAKAIKLNGSNIQPGVIRPRTTVTMKYDGSAWCITAIAGYEQSRSGKFKVDLGLPSGLIWADRNIDVTNQGFSSTIYTSCSYFSWGNTEGYNAHNGTFSYDFGTSNDGPYASTDGARLTGNIPPSMDAARVVCGAPWRMPTSEEFQELFDNCDFIDANGDVIPASTANKIITYGGVNGILLKSRINGNTIFFPCWGYGYGYDLVYQSSYGHYWASSLASTIYGKNFSFYNGGVYYQDVNERCLGFPIRPVQ